MSLHRMLPRVVPVDEQRVPVFPNGRSPRVIASIVLAVALLPAILALVDDRLGFRLVMGALAVLIVTVGVALHVMAGAIEPRVVHVVKDAPTLHFIPPAAATVPVLAIGVALFLPAIAQLVVDMQGLATMSGGFVVRRSPYLLGILGLATLAVSLWRLREPAGLELTPEGLRGIRGYGHVEWRWEDLAQVSVSAAPAAKLSLMPRGGGRPVLAPTLGLGSDPNEVAAIVRYYLERPAERGALADGGAAAVRRVEDALTARTA